jgi:L-histidine Nalpha-methyltransferase
MKTLTDSGSVRIHSLLAESSERRLADDVLDGLTRPFKELPPKHFYDARGSELFDRITELPEYYPTRAERQILEARAAELAEGTGAGELLELGSGSAEKARILLDAMDQTGALRRYVALDVSEQALRQAADELTADYDGLEFEGLVGDFERHLGSIPQRDSVPRIVALLGGTIGNFPPGTRRRLLREIGQVLGPQDRFLLGTDLIKDPALIEAAYDDSAGVTAEFNRNVLHVINRELDADFEPDNFDHVAFFDRQNEWVEMRLRARQAQTAEIRGLGLTVTFEAGEELRTEISAKFTRQRLEDDFRASGLELERWYTDDQERFALSLAAPAGGASGT